MIYEIDHWHGVQGVECSNHSVPTIFTERPKSKDLGFFHFPSFYPWLRLDKATPLDSVLPERDPGFNT